MLRVVGFMHLRLEAGGGRLEEKRKQQKTAFRGKACRHSFVCHSSGCYSSL
jgi:hypothetical protein